MVGEVWARFAFSWEKLQQVFGDGECSGHDKADLEASVDWCLGLSILMVTGRTPSSFPGDASYGDDLFGDGRSALGMAG